MNDELSAAMDMIFGDLNETEKKVISMFPKIKEYCDPESESYRLVLDVIVAMLREYPDLIAYMAEFVSVVNFAYASGIERGKKMVAMQAMLGENENGH